MNWKQEAVEKLRGYPLRRCSLARLEEEMQRLGHEAARLHAADPGHERVSGGSAGRHDDALINNLALREELKHARQSAELWVHEVDAALSHLDEESRQILDGLYLSRTPKSVEMLCQALCMERSTLYRRREHALRQFTLALYGALEL